MALFPMFASAEEISQEDGTKEKCNTAYVYVIDSSSSMRYIFDDIKEIVKTSIRQCGEDDLLSIVLFGDGATILVSYNSLSESKKKMASSLLDSISPESLYTNLRLAVKQGAECLYKYYSADMAKDYTLVLVTDGKDHPPPNYTKEYSIDDALTQFPDFLPGKQWSFRYLALGGQIDPELFSLVRKYGGKSFDVEKIAAIAKATEKDVVESIIEHPKEWDHPKAMIVDHLGEVRIKRDNQEWILIPKGKTQEISPGDTVAVAPASKAVISIEEVGKIGLKEETQIRLEDLEIWPVKDLSIIRLELEEGALWNSVTPPADESLTYEVLTPIALTGVRGTDFRVSYDSESSDQTVAVLTGSTEISSRQKIFPFKGFLVNDQLYAELLQSSGSVTLGPIPDEIIQEWKEWSKALTGGIQLSQINFEGTQDGSVRICRGKQKTGGSDCDPVDLLKFGPLEPGKSEVQEMTLQLDESISTENVDIMAMLDIELPDWMTYNIDVDLEDLSQSLATVSVIISVDEDASPPSDKEWRGRLILTSNTESISFPKHGIVPLVAYTEPRGFVDSAREDDKTFAERIRFRWDVLGSSACFVGLVLAIRLFWNKRIRISMGYIQPEGLLVTTKKPKEIDLGNLNLENISRSLKKSVWKVGRDSEADICLPHDSVGKFHAEIFSKSESIPQSIYIRSVEPCDVRINNVPVPTVKGAVLKNGDIVTIGAFQFFLADTHLEQVVIHYADGAVKYGILKTWNIDEDGFFFEPTAGDSDQLFSNVPSKKLTYVSFKELKGVFFVKDFDTNVVKRKRILPRLRKGNHISIRFRDGEKIKGYTIGTYDPQAPRFYIRPKAEKGLYENSLFILIEKEFTRKIKIEG